MIRAAIITKCTSERLTVYDIAWLSEWAPTLFFGKRNFRLFMGTRMPREKYFKEFAAAVWMVHVMLLETFVITPDESCILLARLRNYI